MRCFYSNFEKDKEKNCQNTLGRFSLIFSYFIFISSINKNKLQERQSPFFKFFVLIIMVY